jgi:TonB family protein
MTLKIIIHKNESQMKSISNSLKVIFAFFFFFGVTNNGIAQSDTNLQSEEIVCVFIEKMPEFPGGNEALQKFLADNLTYPEDARKDKIEARIIVGFVVEEDGSLTNIKVVRGGHQYESLNNAAIQIIEKMPKWIPAKQMGKTVRCLMQLPIQFQLQENK